MIEAANGSPRSAESPETPAEKVTDLKRNLPAPKEAPSPTKISRDLAAQVDREPREVHSFTSLEDSRSYTLEVLNLLPDYQRTDMAMKVIDSELTLQASIRTQSYSREEQKDKVGLVLSWAFTVAFGLVALLNFGVATAMAFGQTVNPKLLEFLGPTVFPMVLGGVTVVAFYAFPAASAAAVKAYKELKTPVGK